MHEKLPDDLISACFDGEATPEERALVEEVLAKSPAARRQWDDYARMSEAIRSFPRDAAPDDLFSAIMHQAERESLLRPLDDSPAAEEDAAVTDPTPAATTQVGAAQSAPAPAELSDSAEEQADSAIAAGDRTPVSATDVVPSAPAPPRSGSSGGRNRRGGWIIATASLAASVAVVTLLVRVLPDHQPADSVPESIASAPAEPDETGDFGTAEVAEFKAGGNRGIDGELPGGNGTGDLTPPLMRGARSTDPVSSDSDKSARRSVPEALALKQRRESQGNSGEVAGGRNQSQDGLAASSVEGFGGGQAAVGFAMRSSGNGSRQGAIVVESLRRQLAVADHGVQMKNVEQFDSAASAERRFSDQNSKPRPAAIAADDAPADSPGNARPDRRPTPSNGAAGALKAEAAFAHRRAMAVPEIEDATIAVVEVTVTDIPAALESLQQYLAVSDIPSGTIAASADRRSTRPAAEIPADRDRKDKTSRQNAGQEGVASAAAALRSRQRPLQTDEIPGDERIPAVYVEADETMLSAGLDRFLDRTADVRIEIRPVVTSRQLAVIDPDNRRVKEFQRKNLPHEPLAQNLAEPEDSDSALMSLATAVQSVRGLLAGNANPNSFKGLQASPGLKKRAARFSKSQPLAADAAPGAAAVPEQADRGNRNRPAPAPDAESVAADNSARGATPDRLPANAVRTPQLDQQAGGRAAAPGFQMKVAVAARPYYQAVASQVDQQTAQGDDSADSSAGKPMQEADIAEQAPAKAAPAAPLENALSRKRKVDAATAAKSARGGTAAEEKPAASPVADAADRVEKAAAPAAPPSADKLADRSEKRRKPGRSAPAPAEESPEPMPAATLSRASRNESAQATARPIRVIFLFRQAPAAPQNAPPQK